MLRSNGIFNIKNEDARSGKKRQLELNTELYFASEGVSPQTKDTVLEIRTSDGPCPIMPCQL